jgi:hypothetical protein
MADGITVHYQATGDFFDRRRQSGLRSTFREEQLVTPAGAHCCSAVSKRGETDNHLYLQLKSAAVSPFHGFRRTVGVICMGAETAKAPKF